VRQLSYKIDGRSVLDGIDMHIKSGETYSIMGPSGVGKSTLIKCIGGLIRPTSGQLLIDGIDIAQLDEERLNPIRRRIGMVFQSAALFDSLSVYENVAFGLRRHTRLTEKEISEIVSARLRW